MNQDTIRQLRFIRSLFNKARAEAQRPYPQSADAVLTLHDCVEMWLVLASEQEDVEFSIDRPDFMAYWKMQRGGKPFLTHKKNMEKLNELRKRFKHSMIWPAAQDIEDILPRVSDFLEENTKKLYNRDFSSFSMLDLVQSTSCREQLEAAQAHMEAGQAVQAMDALMFAFADLVNERRELEAHHAQQRNMWTRTPLRAPHGLHNLGHDVDAFLNDVADRLSNNEVAIRLMGWGGDYHKYARFRSLTTQIVGTSVGRRALARLPGDVPTPQDCEFALDFVIETALRVQALPVW